MALVGSFDLGLITDAGLWERLQWNLLLPRRFSQPHERLVLASFLSERAMKFSLRGVMTIPPLLCSQLLFFSPFSQNQKKKKNVCFVARGNRIPLFIWHAFPRLLSSRQPATWNYLASNFLPFFFFFFFFFSRTHRCKWKHFPVDTFVTCSFLLTRERNVVMNCDHCVFSHFQPRYVVQILTVSHSSCIH